MKQYDTKEILHTLEAIENGHDVRVLYACESGSRAWGFASPNSDWDVRFIYMRPPSWYLSPWEKTDTIGFMSHDRLLDMGGWDFKKACKLMHKSNPPLLEWLRSPIVYEKDEMWFKEFNEMADNCFSPKASVYHYLHMARGNSKDELYLGTDRERVKLKKYFYVLRPLIACRWVEKYGTHPPTNFLELIKADLDIRAILPEIEALLAAKAVTKELGLAPRNPLLDEFIATEIERLKGIADQMVVVRTALRGGIDYMFSSWVHRG